MPQLCEELEESISYSMDTLERMGLFWRHASRMVSASSLLFHMESNGPKISHIAFKLVWRLARTLE